MSEPKSGSPADAITEMKQRVQHHRWINFAALYLGVPALARALDIEERSIRAKVSGDRGTNADDIRALVPALEARATAIATLLDAIRAARPCPPAIERIDR